MCEEYFEDLALGQVPFFTIRQIASTARLRSRIKFKEAIPADFSLIFRKLKHFSRHNKNIWCFKFFFSSTWFSMMKFSEENSEKLFFWCLFPNFRYQRIKMNNSAKKFENWWKNMSFLFILTFRSRKWQQDLKMECFPENLKPHSNSRKLDRCVLWKLKLKVRSDLRFKKGNKSQKVNFPHRPPTRLDVFGNVFLRILYRKMNHKNSPIYLGRGKTCKEAKINSRYSRTSCFYVLDYTYIWFSAL